MASILSTMMSAAGSGWLGKVETFDDLVVITTVSHPGNVAWFKVDYNLALFHGLERDDEWPGMWPSIVVDEGRQAHYKPIRR